MKIPQRLNKGITLVALIITIIIMLILASVSVNVVINGGLFEQAGSAKNSVEIASEKEIIQNSVIYAKGLSKTGRITKEELQKSINKLANENSATVYNFDENFVIIFETKRAYTVDKEGKILSIEEKYTNSSKMFIAQVNDTTYGTGEKPYEINCIEDLVDLSFAVNGIELSEDGTLSYTATVKNFKGKYIKLITNLCFASELSYEDAMRTDYGDINGNGEIESLLQELTTGTGWIPIGDGIKGTFYGNFDGLGNRISNLYIYNEEETSYTGLFGYVSNGNISNISVSGNIYCNSSSAGGILAHHFVNNSNTYTIDNCCFAGIIENINEDGETGGLLGSCYANLELSNSHNEAKVIGLNIVGGVIGQGGQRIYDCYNTGEITGVNKVGGITGNTPIVVENCYNTAKITATGEQIGGIVGCIYAGNDRGIYQCYNTGDIRGVDSIGGILGRNYSSTYLTVEQCYNTGQITGTTFTAGIVGYISGGNSRTLNCYNTGDVIGTNIAGIASGNGNITTAIIISCYNNGRLEATTKYGVLSRRDPATTYNSYYLSTCGATDTIATSIVDADLKTSASTLDKKYTINKTDNTVSISETEKQNVWVADSSNINKGYPILSWQVPQNSNRKIEAVLGGQGYIPALIFYM